MIQRPTGLSSLATLWIPVGIALACFLGALLLPQSSGAGISDSNRPIAFILLALTGAVGWIVGAADVAGPYLELSRLPNTARVLVAAVARPTPTPRQGPARQGQAQRLVNALIARSALMFIAPMLLGWLFQPGVYRPVEAAIVAAMGLVVVAWSAVLAQAWTRRG